MSYIKHLNQMDRWRETLSKFQTILTNVPLSEVALKNPKNFECLLTAGNIEGVDSLSVLNNQDFLQIEKLANYWFEDGQDNLDAFNSERLKRFGRYG